MASGQSQGCSHLGEPKANATDRRMLDQCPQTFLIHAGIRFLLSTYCLSGAKGTTGNKLYPQSLPWRCSVWGTDKWIQHDSGISTLTWEAWAGGCYQGRRESPEEDGERSKLGKGHSPCWPFPKIRVFSQHHQPCGKKPQQWETGVEGKGEGETWLFSF